MPFHLGFSFTDERGFAQKVTCWFLTSPIRIRRSPMSNSHVQSAKAIAEDIAHLCCVPDDWRFQISDQAALPSPTLQLPQERNPLRIISINDVAELSKDGPFFTA